MSDLLKDFEWFGRDDRSHVRPDLSVPELGGFGARWDGGARPSMTSRRVALFLLRVCLGIGALIVLAAARSAGISGACR